jgi:ArsR family transcriptional regulator
LLDKLFFCDIIDISFEPLNLELAMTEEMATSTSGIFTALSDPTRVRIVNILSGGPRPVSEIAKQMNIPIVNVSHHLGIMKNSKVVSSEKKGRQNIYSLRDTESSEGKLTIRKEGVCVIVDIDNN